MLKRGLWLAITLVGASLAMAGGTVRPTPLPRPPFDAERAKALQHEWAKAFGVDTQVTNSVGIKLVLIPAGQFTMGPNGSTYRVTLDRPFFLGATEVTLGEYRQFRASHKIDGADDEFNADDRPAAMVSWKDARAFCAWLTEHPAEKQAGRIYSLPTEAQWEWAARAGTITSRHFGDTDKGQAEYAWFNVTYTPNPKHETNGRGRQPVGKLKPNAFGLYDILGNVWEWCSDLRVDEATGETREPVMRGGSWRSGAFHCTAVAHDPGDPSLRADNIGFRVACRMEKSKTAGRSNDQPVALHPDAPPLRKVAQVAAESKLDSGRFDAATLKQLQKLVASLTDAQVRRDAEQLLPTLEVAAARHANDRLLLAEIKRLGGKAKIEVVAPDWLRSIAGDAHLPVFGRLAEIDLNERTDGHKDPVPKKLSDRVSDDWLKNLAGQDHLQRLELSGTAITSNGLVHLKTLRKIEWLNLCLTAVDDRGFEHLAGMTGMRRMIVCSSKVTGTGFKHLQNLKQVESINLHSSPASDAGLEAIGKLTSLRRLEIVHTQVTDAGLKHLAGLANLQQLHIHGPQTTAKALPFLGQLKELYQLDVYDRAASNETLEQIARLPKLRMLMLTGGFFDDDGVKHLAKLRTLEELSLDSSKMTEAAIDYLAGLENLRKLHLGRTSISAAGRQRLHTTIPKAVISP